MLLLLLSPQVEDEVFDLLVAVGVLGGGCVVSGAVGALAGAGLARLDHRHLSSVGRGGLNRPVVQLNECGVSA